MATDGLLNDNREERKKTEFFDMELEAYKLMQPLEVDGHGDMVVDFDARDNMIWDWIQAYVKEEVARVDNSALVEEVLKVETNDV